MDLKLLAVLALIGQVYGHGFMYFPWNWSDKNQIDPEEVGMKGSKWENDYNIPDNHCNANSGVPCHSAMFKGRSTDWFTNYTWIPGEPTHWAWKPTPWAAPGTAPILGEGCGANGGNPYPQGCNAGNGADPNPYGTQCNFNGGYVGGRSAMDHASEGLFNNAPVNEWKRGTVQYVYWASGARHGGGYAYRLCKVPSGGISKITEKCFQDGHLQFHESYNWLYDRPWRKFDSQKWMKRSATTMSSGTYPSGSQWRVIDLPYNSFWAFKDMVKIPADLVPGDYVLSFRWDCKRTPQIWSTCANIKIVT